jgi:hypothetical protein
MPPPSASRLRVVAVTLGAACTVQLVVAGVVVAYRWDDGPPATDVLQTLEETPTATPTSATPTAVPSGSSTAAPEVGVTPGGSDASVSPGPAASGSVPPDEPSSRPAQTSRCHDVAYVDAPDSTARFAVDHSGEDAGGLVVEGGAAYFTETKRDGSFDTTLVRVDLSTGLERHSERDPFFNLTDVSAGHGWGVDHGGVVEIDGVSGKVVRRWGTAKFPVGGSGGLYNQPGLVSVDGASAYVFGFDGPEVALSRIDVPTGDVRWTIPLPVEGAGTGFSSGPRRIVDAYGGATYVALPMRPGDQDVLRVWKVDGSGKVVRTRDVTVPKGDANGPSQLVVTGDGVFTSMTTAGGDLDATILRLDPDSLSTLASTDVNVLEDLAVGADTVWAVTLQCNTFLWHRFTTGELARVDHPWALPDQSYTVGATGEEVWSLRTREPMEAVAVVAYPSS